MTVAWGTHQMWFQIVSGQPMNMLTKGKILGIAITCQNCWKWRSVSGAFVFLTDRSSESLFRANQQGVAQGATRVPDTGIWPEHLAPLRFRKPRRVEHELRSWETRLGQTKIKWPKASSPTALCWYTRWNGVRSSFLQALHYSARWDSGESHYEESMIHCLSVKQLADCLKVRTELLYDISNNTENFYKIYTIPKKMGNSELLKLQFQFWSISKKLFSGIFYPGVCIL